MDLHYTVLLFSVVCLVLTDNSRDSRILLNDPNLLISQIQALESKIQLLTTAYHDQQSTIHALQSQVQTGNNGGAVYVRWGKTSCPANISETVYSGFMGGSDPNSVGGAANAVCLTSQPVLKEVGGEGQFMGGAEYGSDSFGPTANNDVPCAVCRGLLDRSVLMIPGTDVCTPGWNLQYHGLLAAGHETHKSATQFICVDHDAESIIGGESPLGLGRQIYAVRARCGSLECPPYHNSKELTCVVCTK